MLLALYSVSLLLADLSFWGVWSSPMYQIAALDLVYLINLARRVEEESCRLQRLMHFGYSKRGGGGGASEMWQWLSLVPTTFILTQLCGNHLPYNDIDLITWALVY